MQLCRLNASFKSMKAYVPRCTLVRHEDSIWSHFAMNMTLQVGSPLTPFILPSSPSWSTRANPRSLHHRTHPPTQAAPTHPEWQRHLFQTTIVSAAPDLGHLAPLSCPESHHPSRTQVAHAVRVAPLSATTARGGASFRVRVNPATRWCGGRADG